MNLFYIFLITIGVILAWFLIGALTCGLSKRIFGKEVVENNLDKTDTTLILLGPISLIIFIVYCFIVIYYSLLKWIAYGFKRKISNKIS